MTSVIQVVRVISDLLEAKVTLVILVRLVYKAIQVVKVTLALLEVKETLALLEVKVT